MNKIVLMVEDDINLLKMNTELLKRHGYTVHSAKNVKQAKMFINDLDRIDIAILDVVLPDGNGFDLATTVKNRISCPILMLTSKNSHEDIVEGMISDADMYITKPFVITDLMARIEGLIKKQQNYNVPPIIKGSLKLDVNSRQAIINGNDLTLTPKEFSLLLCLVMRENELVSMEILFKEVWGQTLGSDTSALRMSIARLRKKLIGSEYTINSNRNKGYVFERE